jgi:hypothetical protein
MNTFRKKGTPIKAIQVTQYNIAQIHEMLYGEKIDTKDKYFERYCSIIKRAGFDLPNQKNAFLFIGDVLCQRENGTFFVKTFTQFMEEFEPINEDAEVLLSASIGIIERYLCNNDKKDRAEIAIDAKKVYKIYYGFDFSNKVNKSNDIFSKKHIAVVCKDDEDFNDFVKDKLDERIVYHKAIDDYFLFNYPVDDFVLTINWHSNKNYARLIDSIERSIRTKRIVRKDLKKELDF